MVYDRQHSFETLCITTKLVYASFFIFGIAPKTKQKMPSFILTFVWYCYHDLFVFPAKKRKCLEDIFCYVSL